MTAGYEAQRKSIDAQEQGKALPLAKGTTVYVFWRHKSARRTFFGQVEPDSFDYLVSMDVVKKYFAVTEDFVAADAVFVFVESPDGGPGYDRRTSGGGNGYVLSASSTAATAEHA
jgi:beta-glucosidase